MDVADLVDLPFWRHLNVILMSFGRHSRDIRAPWFVTAIAATLVDYVASGWRRDGWWRHPPPSPPLPPSLPPSLPPLPLSPGQMASDPPALSTISRRFDVLPGTSSDLLQLVHQFEILSYQFGILFFFFFFFQIFVHFSVEAFPAEFQRPSPSSSSSSSPLLPTPPHAASQKEFPLIIHIFFLTWWKALKVRDGSEIGRRFHHRLRIGRSFPHFLKQSSFFLFLFTSPSFLADSSASQRQKNETAEAEEEEESNPTWNVDGMCWPVFQTIVSSPECWAIVLRINLRTLLCFPYHALL